MSKQDLIERKRGAIKAKDVNQIVADRIHLPITLFGSESEKTDTVTSWLQGLIDILDAAEKFTDAEIGVEIKTLYQKLCPNCKELADSRVSGVPINRLPCEIDFKTFYTLHLYRFSVGVFE